MVTNRAGTHFVIVVALCWLLLGAFVLWLTAVQSRWVYWVEAPHALRRRARRRRNSTISRRPGNRLPLLLPWFAPECIVSLRDLGRRHRIDDLPRPIAALRAPQLLFSYRCRGVIDSDQPKGAPRRSSAPAQRT